MGMGHVLRSVELASEIMRTDSHATVHFIVNNNPVSIKTLEATQFRFTIEGKVAAVAEAEKSDAIIFDLPGEILNDTKYLRKRDPTIWITALDYFNYENEDVNAIFNLVNHNLRQEKPTNPSLLYFEGPEFGILRQEFITWIGKPKDIPARAKNVLISFGGSDPQKNTLSVIHALAGQTFEGVTFHFTIGANFAHAAEVKKGIAKLRCKTEFHEGVTDIGKLIHVADFALCGSGTTILEMTALGTPSLVIAQSPEEVRFARVFEKQDASRCLGQAFQAKPELILKAITAMIDDQHTRALLSKSGMKIVDGKGKVRIVKTIFEAVKAS